MSQRQSGRGAKVATKPRTAVWRRAVFVATAAVVVVLDQVSKSWVLETPGLGSSLRLLGELIVIHPTLNPGGIFGVFPGAGWVFLVLTAAVVGLLAVWAWRQESFPSIFGLVLGGGAGNLLDRVFRGPRLFTGRVVDFIELPYWPTFNIADSAISVGVFILLVRWVLLRDDERDVLHR